MGISAPGPVSMLQSDNLLLYLGIIFLILGVLALEFWHQVFHESDHVGHIAFHGQAVEPLQALGHSVILILSHLGHPDLLMTGGYGVLLVGEYLLVEFLSCNPSSSMSISS